MAAGVGLNGTGSSFAAPEISQWTIDTAKAPYNLNMNFTSSSSGDGRFQFANKTVNFGVTDIAYQPYPFDVTARRSRSSMCRSPRVGSRSCTTSAG